MAIKLGRLIGKPANQVASTLQVNNESLPDAQPFPTGRYLFLVGGVPRKFAGRTSSILAKTKLWYESYGVESLILAVHPTAEMDDLTHRWHEDGTLSPGVRIESLHDYYPDQTTASAATTAEMLQGLRALPESDQPVSRYYDKNGIYRIYQRLDYAGRLIVRDWFTENRTRSRRDEFRTDGTLRRTVFMDLVSNTPRQDILYSRAGLPQVSHWTVYDPQIDQLVTQRVIFFDESGAPVRETFDYQEVLHTCLNQVIGGQPAFITCEDRVVDDALLNYANPQVKRLFVLHNAHLREPYDNVHAIRSTYQPLFADPKRFDAVVFLTHAQHADAEAHYGKQDRFQVIPHSAAPAVVDPGIKRELRRVIMMARLDVQKQVDHAIAAFAEVVKVIPDAKLEIYGKGELKSRLQAQIKQLGVGKQVKLMGFTDNPAATYQGAGLCIMSSRFEGQPLTILESLSHSCPMIAYDLKYGPADAIENGINGFLVPYGDKSALAKQIIAVLRDPALHERLVAGSAASVTRFSQDALVRRWSGLMNELAN